MLQNCLVSVVAQIEESGGDDTIIVVENDEVETSRHVVTSLANAHPSLRIDYIHEPELGIPVARNRCLEAALESDAVWLAFIDDDETLEPGWLDAMRQATRDLKAEVITGPAIPVLTDELPIWMPPPKPRSLARGQRLKTAPTSNTILDLNWFKAKAADLRFDKVFIFTGGSDTDFFYRVADKGGRIRWVDDAVVAEYYTRERLTVRWNINRAKRVQAHNAIIHKKRKGMMYSIFRTTPKIIGKFFRGLLLLLGGVLFYLFNRQRASIYFVEGLSAIAASLGALQGLFGIMPNVYEKIIGE